MKNPSGRATKFRALIWTTTTDDCEKAVHAGHHEEAMHSIVRLNAITGAFTEVLE